MCPEASASMLSRTRSDDAVNRSNSTYTFSLLSPPPSPRLPAPRLHKHSASLVLTPLVSFIPYSRPSTAVSDDPFSTAEWFTRSETPRAHKTLVGLSAPPSPSSFRTKRLPRMIRASSPPSRPTSPFHGGDFIPRPPSRSEHLLRDTLRRAEEYERKHISEVHRGRPRPTHDSYFAPMANPDFNDQEEDLNSRRLGSFVFRSPGGAPSSPRPVRATSARPRSPDPRYIPYGTPASPSPMPPMIPRTKTAPAMTSGLPSSSQHPVEPQPSSPLASSSHSRLPQRRMSHRSHPSSSHSSSVEHSPLMRSAPLSPVSPHEVALRSKVEGLLKNAADAFENREQAHKSALESRRHRRSKSYSHAVVHTLSIVPDVPSIPRSPGSHISLESKHTTRSMSNSLALDHIPTPRSGFSSPSSPPEIMTPPPTPPFNAQLALEACKRMDGYVSFASVEGLGEPPGLDVDAIEELHEGVESKAWTKWLRVWPFQGNEHFPANPGLPITSVGNKEHLQLTASR